jgi:hypothetical protein
MVDILAQNTPAVQLVGRTGTPDRARAVQGLRDFLTGLTDFRADMDVWTPTADLYGAYLRWAEQNCRRFVLGQRQFIAEVRMAVGASAAYVRGAAVIRFVALTPQAV